MLEPHTVNDEVDSGIGDRLTFEHKMQIAEQEDITQTKQAVRTFARNFTRVRVESLYDLD